jgi:hypothetical protein
MADLEQQSSVHSKEKATTVGVDESSSTEEGQVIDISNTYVGALGRVSRWLEHFGVESRGYQRVLPEERSKQSFWGLCLIW